MSEYSKDKLYKLLISRKEFICDSPSDLAKAIRSFMNTESEKEVRFRSALEKIISFGGPKYPGEIEMQNIARTALGKEEKDGR